MNVAIAQLAFWRYAKR